ncbi:MAG: BrnT family toxin [Treponema sp.]|nr:BrnT family toxin [Treponema sp.]
MTSEIMFSWNEAKRQENIKKRGLDIAVLASKVFADPNVIFRQDIRKDYGEDRYLAYGMASGLRICICFTLRGEVVHLITIFKVNKKDWEKYYAGKIG